ncbi:MAG TPA: Ycf66 family protein [Flavisolibacter sp.]|nr:Ycf66 family protein [Flavisolibacter sp.]
MENQGGTHIQSTKQDNPKSGTMSVDSQGKMSEHTEGPIAKAIEKETSKLPSDLFLWGGLGLLAGSVLMFSLKQKHGALLLGQFGAPILIMGLYNKTVKQSGHDALDKKPS